jgi:hypothetical protein
VDRTQKILLGLCLLALPALAPAAQSYFRTPASLCLISGGATYRVVQAATAPSYRIRIDNSTAAPDLRMQPVDRPEIADLVLADEFDQPERAGCRSLRGVRTVLLDTGERPADVTVRLAADEPAPDYRIYVRSLRHSQDEAAALLAAMWKAAQKRELARRP